MHALRQDKIHFSPCLVTRCHDPAGSFWPLLRSCAVITSGPAATQHLQSCMRMSDSPHGQHPSSYASCDGTQHGHVAGPPVPLVLESAVYELEGGSAIPDEECEAYMLVVWSCPARLGSLHAVPQAHSSPVSARAGPTCWKQGVLRGNRPACFYHAGSDTSGPTRSGPHVRKTASGTCNEGRRGRRGMAGVEPAHVPARTTAAEKRRTLRL